jgi:DNA-binding transcriptional regulator YbjK
MAAEPTRSRGRRDPRGERRRAELLEAAIHLMGAHGLDAVTHRGVAAQAGAPPASTSYYFRSKDDLIDEALRTVTEGEIARLRARREGLGDDATADVAALTEGLAAWIEEEIGPEGRIRLLAQYHLQIEASRRPAARAILERWAAETDELAEQAMRALGAADPARAAILLVCFIDGLRLRLLASKHQPLTGPELRATLRALLDGLLAA